MIIKRYGFIVGLGKGAFEYVAEPYELSNGEWVRYSDIADLIADAKRYRWLREYQVRGPQVYLDDDCNTWLSEGDCDAAIDAAMGSKE